MGVAVIWVKNLASMAVWL